MPIKLVSIAALAMVLFAACGGSVETDSTVTNSDTNIFAKQTWKPWPLVDSSKIVTYPSGLKLYMVEEGTGPVPVNTSDVTANYHGTLVDGKVFDSSFDRGQPATFNLGQVIQGWQEGLTKVKVGSKFILIIPPALGYGEQNQPNIPANSTLVFHIHLLSASGV